MKGFTALELMLAVAIIGIILGIGISSYYKFLDQQALNEASEGVVNLLQKARAYTLSSKGIDAGATEGSCYGVKFYDNDESLPKRNFVEIIDKDNNPLNPPIAFALSSRTVLREGKVFQKQTPGTCPSGYDKEIVHFQRLTGAAFIMQGSDCGNASKFTLCDNGETYTNRIYIDLKKSIGTNPSRIIRLLPTGVVEVSSQ